MIKLSDKYCIVRNGGNVSKYRAITIEDFNKNKDKHWQYDNMCRYAPYETNLASGNSIKETVQELIKNLVIKDASSKEPIEIKDLIKELNTINYFEF